MGTGGGQWHARTQTTRGPCSASGRTPWLHAILIRSFSSFCCSSLLLCVLPVCSFQGALKVVSPNASASSEGMAW
jgi:hypothetical protein